jgi:hypothetical protein
MIATPSADEKVTAVNGWLLAYDNITSIPGWLSDSLCRLVFGAGFSRRALFSASERNVLYTQRPVILNGIEDYVRKSDLVDRTVFLELPFDGIRMGMQPDRAPRTADFTGRPTDFAFCRVAENGAAVHKRAAPAFAAIARARTLHHLPADERGPAGHADD